MITKIISCLSVGTLISLGGVTTAQAAIEEGKLVIWINGDKGYKGLQKVADRFTKDTEIVVKVAHPDKATDKFQQAAATGNGPDIFIWAHDRFGEWAKSGLIAPINPSKQTKQSIADFTWDAVTIDGNVYGYPIALEAVGLIYNKQLIASPPKSFDDIFTLHKQLAKQNKKAIMWDYNNTYFSWGLFASNGGYAFKKTASGYNVNDTGVNNAGSLVAGNMIKRLIDEGVMAKGIDYGVMDAAFNKGEVAMMINGPWSWSNLKKSSIDFGVTSIPSINNKQGKPFTGVLAATINAASPNKELAVEFLEQYMLKVEGLKTINKDVPLGAVANKQLMAELSKDPNIKATFENAKLGEAMPSVPEMGAFWAAMKPALTNITSGRQSVKAALDDAAKRITHKK
ncbi:maltose/maltodextrin ABC transporter substrate-binding protein MalE [Endozoicomonas sp. SM1973]|uniref:Maltodextrin-binding protein n=1 Tax=Spartinivicinus marinus TaxID=2994442 RepID=A0A853IGK5_9GAMM|nr:maltose/maltodextrin ABC transporter substrate-binding protein MalE [Spartinivicinus marinus]MCX4028394.1 maltose/maltodextrin ABC transporter substrate-binding protein MalE [Spartinivicinus marinus]NYZ68607.1 maltose/maltodextrin ABC transporter substrate-binding protein MalE [Spartinivicinus marinus]